MSLDRMLIVVFGPLLVASGLLCAATPSLLGQLAGFSASASGLTDLRAVYGGFQVGLGGFLLWCRRDPERLRAGLVALGLSLGGLALLRLVGLLVDQAPTAYLLGNLALEVGAGALVVLALSRVRRPVPA